MPTRREFLFTGLATTLLNKTAIGSPTNISPKQPNVVFNFDGLMAMAMGNPSRVSAGILDVHHHTPQLTITKIIPNGNGKNDAKQLVTTLEAKQLKGELFVDVQAATRASEKCRVNKYNSANGVRGDARDLRWAVDFNELYPKAGKLHIKEDKLWSKIHINGGNWFTSKLSDFRWRFISADTNNPTTTLPFDRRIGSISAQIDMDNGDVLAIRNDQVDIRMVMEEGINYEVQITNLPPTEMANIDHFLYYYDAIEEPLAKYIPVAASRAAFSLLPDGCAPHITIDLDLSTP